jgi:hypothetical protein
MGTQAYWLKQGYRMRQHDADGDPGPWVHVPNLADLREEAAETLKGGESAEVQKYDRHAEGYLPYATITKTDRTVRLTRKA